MTTRSGLSTDDLAGRTDDPVDRQDVHPDHSDHSRHSAHPGRSEHRDHSAPRPTSPDLDGNAARDAGRTGARRDATSGDAVRTTRLGTAPAPSPDSPADDLPLLDGATADPFAERWRDVQTRFVDDPRAAVRDADGLVAELMQTLAERFAGHKSRLEEQWNRGAEPGTEELRLAMQQYRSFFHRLLAA